MPSGRPPSERSRPAPPRRPWRSWRWRRCRWPICQAMPPVSGSRRWGTSPVADRLRALTLEDIRALELGAAILGTGGGGNPYIGRLRTEQLLKGGHTLWLLPFAEVRDDDVVLSVGGIGAPVVGIEKIEHGDECYQAMRAVERATNQPITALISGEIGGANSMEPM